MSEWDTIIGFVFYVAPCTALWIWITSATDVMPPYMKLAGTIASLIGCTLLFHWMRSPATSIDKMLVDIKNQTEQKHLDDFVKR